MQQLLEYRMQCWRSALQLRVLPVLVRFDKQIQSFALPWRFTALWMSSQPCKPQRSVSLHQRDIVGENTLSLGGGGGLSALQSSLCSCWMTTEMGPSATCTLSHGDRSSHYRDISFNTVLIGEPHQEPVCSAKKNTHGGKKQSDREMISHHFFYTVQPQAGGRSMTAWAQKK